MGWLHRLFPQPPAGLRPEPVTVTPGRLETRFGDPARVVFRVEAPGAGAHQTLHWTVRKLDGGSGCTAGKLADPFGEKGVFLAFPVEETIILRVRATLAGTGRFGEATLVVHPPVPSRGGGRERSGGYDLAGSGLAGAFGL
jgi:hypothetical protein